MQIDRLDRVAAAGMHDVIALRQPHHVAEVHLVADPPSALQVGAVGRAGDLREHQVLAADLHIALRIARMQREFRGAGLDALQDQVGCKRRRYCDVDRLARVVPLARPARRRVVPLAEEASDMETVPLEIRRSRLSIRQLAHVHTLMFMPGSHEPESCRYRDGVLPPITTRKRGID